jgi:hypothetical protein
LIEELVRRLDLKKPPGFSNTCIKQVNDNDRRRKAIKSLNSFGKGKKPFQDKNMKWREDALSGEAHPGGQEPARTVR